MLGRHVVNQVRLVQQPEKQEPLSKLKHQPADARRSVGEHRPALGTEAGGEAALPPGLLCLNVAQALFPAAASSCPKSRDHRPDRTLRGLTCQA